MTKTKLPTIFAISMFPSVSLQQEETLNHLLEVFEKYENSLPDHWGYDEMVRLQYSREEILEKVMLGQPKFTEIHLHRNSDVKYTGSFSLDISFRSFLHFKFNSLPKALWPTFFELSERLANIVQPRYGITHIFWPSVIPWQTDRQRLHRWMNFCAQPAPVNFGPIGPLGLGNRTLTMK